MNRENWVVFLPFYLLICIITIGIANFGSKAVTVIRENQPVERERCIIIDAGHGGIDGGATSCTGVLESKINLEIAKRFNDLVQFLGYDTRMIRTTDISVYTQGSTIAAQKISDLKERVRIGNETPGALYVSIHQNTFSDSRYGGAQVFYGESQESRNLAAVLQSKFIETVNPGSHRSPKNSKGIYLMQNLSCTAVLIECGFLSNPKEEALLRENRYQKYLCSVIASVISNFISS